MGSQDTLVFSPDDPSAAYKEKLKGGKVHEGIESVHKRLRDAQESLEGVRSDLHKICFGMKSGLALSCFGQVNKLICNSYTLLHFHRA